jgi:hypothetical protein
MKMRRRKWRTELATDLLLRDWIHSARGKPPLLEPGDHGEFFFRA